MKVTSEFIHRNKTQNGGWTKSQLAIVGVDFPPQKGWISRVVGMEITDEDAERFRLLGLPPAVIHKERSKLQREEVVAFGRNRVEDALLNGRYWYGQLEDLTGE